MMLTEDDRTRLRALQDEIVAEAQNRGYSDDTPLSVAMPAYATLAAMRVMIFPEYETEMRHLLTWLKEG